MHNGVSLFFPVDRDLNHEQAEIFYQWIVIADMICQHLENYKWIASWTFFVTKKWWVSEREKNFYNLPVSPIMIYLNK